MKNNLVLQMTDSMRDRKSNDNSSDLIKIQSDIHLADKKGNLIKVKVPRPEYMSEIFFNK